MIIISKDLLHIIYIITIRHLPYVNQNYILMDLFILNLSYLLVINLYWYIKGLFILYLFNKLIPRNL